MSLTERFEEFMAKVDWDELTTGEKEALYEATYGAPNEDGIPFKVITDDNDNVIIEYVQENARIKIPRDHLRDFRQWLEETYMGGELGEAYLAEKAEKEKDEAREMRKIRYAYEVDQVVLGKLKKYFSPYSIGRDENIGGDKFEWRADFVVYDNLNGYRLIIEVKPFDYISIDNFLQIFAPIYNGELDVYYILTDGQRAVYAHSPGEIIMELSLSILLAKISTRMEALQDSFEVESAKKCFLRAIEETKTGDKGEKIKKRNELIEFVKSLSKKDIESDEKKKICNLKEDKESQLFKLLVGTYAGSIVRFSSARRLYKILEDGKMDMCSLVCMNDPSEKDYADRYLGLPNIIDNAKDTFIISACSTDKENDLTTWRLYGDDTKGICIRLELNRDFNLTKNGFYLARISYGEAPNVHYELDIIKNIFSFFKEIGWRFTFCNWGVWKHFFKKHSYAIEDEIRLLYMPNRKSKNEGKWYKDDRTGIYSEMKLFDLTDSKAFPLTIGKVILGTNFPYPVENVKQFTARLKETKILTIGSKDEVFVKSKIEDYR